MSETPVPVVSTPVAAVPAASGATAAKKKKNKKKKAKAKTANGVTTAPVTNGTTNGAAVPTASTPATELKAAASAEPRPAPALSGPTTTETYITAEGKKEITLPASAVPNVQSKLSEKEQARLQAQIGNLRKVGGIFVTDETKETKKFETKSRETDLKLVPTVYIKNCNDCHYHIAQRSTKVLIESCKNTTVILDGDILTRTVEIWKCENFTLQVGTQIKTLQLDLMKGVNMTFEKQEHFGAIVWANIEDAKLSFADAKQHDIETGFKQMLTDHPDSHVDVDQFIIRLIDSKLTIERCVRLKNGFLSTEREAVEWEKRNESKKAAYVEDFLKEAGVHLKKSKDAKRVDRNADCPCGSGKKYKKCCANKKELTGTEEVKKAIV